MRLYNYILQESDNSYFIIHSYDGYDELSLTGKFKLIANNQEQVLTPEQIGLPTVTEADLYAGSTVEESVNVFMSILHNQGTPAQKAVVAANAGMAIHCIKRNVPLVECIAMAHESLESKKALSVYKQLLSIN
jgi:anthranilate phosphoribosyltransferase